MSRSIKTAPRPLPIKELCFSLWSNWHLQVGIRRTGERGKLHTVPHKHTAGLVLTSFRPGQVELPPGTPTEMDELVADESVNWQHLSSIAADAANLMMPSPIRRTYSLDDVQHEIPRNPRFSPKDPNRVLEIHGLMGAIGEQIGLALTADLDSRRLMAEALTAPQDELIYRLRIRAMAEMSAYFSLGAAHSLANLTLRFLLLHPHMAQQIDPTGKKYPVGDDNRKTWGTLNSLSQILKNQTQAAGKGPLGNLLTAVIDLQSSADFKALDERRGMDFHRRRPQSVEHTAPTAGIFSNENGFTTLRMPTPMQQPEADPSTVHALAQAGLFRVGEAMQVVRKNLGPALRKQGYTYIW